MRRRTTHSTPGPAGSVAGGQPTIPIPVGRTWRSCWRAGVGGRIFERTPEGQEWDWGEVTAWDPPTRLVYLWHLKRDRAEATEVEIRFVALADDATRVDIEHRGWEALGTEGQTWRDRNMGGWATLLPHFERAVSMAEVKEERA